MKIADLKLGNILECEHDGYEMGGSYYFVLIVGINADDDIISYKRCNIFGRKQGVIQTRKFNNFSIRSIVSKSRQDGAANEYKNNALRDKAKKQMQRLSALIDVLPCDADLFKRIDSLFYALAPIDVVAKVYQSDQMYNEAIQSQFIKNGSLAFGAFKAMRLQTVLPKPYDWDKIKTIAQNESNNL